MIKNILLVIFSTVIGILFAELFARLLINGPDQKPSTGDPYKLYEFDNKLGWKNKNQIPKSYVRQESYPTFPRVLREGVIPELTGQSFICTYTELYQTPGSCCCCG